MSRFWQVFYTSWATLATLSILMHLVIIIGNGISFISVFAIAFNICALLYIRFVVGFLEAIK